MPSSTAMQRTALLLAAAVAGCVPSGPDQAHLERARELSDRFIIVDGHIDVPHRMTQFEEDVTEATLAGDFDWPRAVKGGLNAPFMSIYIPSELQSVEGAAKARADLLIDMVEGIAARAPYKFGVANTTADVRRHKAEGRISLPMGMENGAPIETLTDAAHFYRRGIRYVGLVHARDNHLSDSSYDTTRTWGGLSPFGKRVVDELNRLGIIVDVSHLTDSAAAQVIRRSRAPVLASHSSVRYFTPAWERNMSDDLIRALAAKGGVIMISFGSTFLRGTYRKRSDLLSERIEHHLAEDDIDLSSERGALYRERERKANPIGTLGDVADHIDYVVRLVGVDHVGLGSDFDGVTALPRGLHDVSTYPTLVAELLDRGYSDDDLEKILGGNALRVWEGVERVAAELRPVD